MSEYRRHDVPDETLQKWQKTVDLMAEIFEVPAGLIMRVLPREIEVLLASRSEQNPYDPGEKANLDTGLYCETVMSTRKPLSVPNALEDADWKDNPDVELNMISYLGVPIICPDGSVFGTICVLDDHTRNFLPVYTEMLGAFRGIIEQDLRMLDQQRELHDANAKLSHELAVARELSVAADRDHQLWLQGDSIAIRALRQSIAAHAESHHPLLLTGENGAGQEAVARAIHRQSDRSDRPFIYVACAHISDSEATLFGNHKDSPVTGMLGPESKLTLAHGGTLYLEGIECLAFPAQQKLAKVLQDTIKIRADGQNPTPDVRIIAYASSDLGPMVSRGEFASELFRLLGASRISVPSLAERREDIVSLAEHIAALRSIRLGKSITGIDQDSQDRLLRYRWPGNLDELQSVIDRAVVLANSAFVEIPEELLLEGKRVGGYALQRRLAAGSMGEVWLGRHSLLARPAAVKLIRPKDKQEGAETDRSATRRLLEKRFQREAQATAGLRSPHTVELYDFGVSEQGEFYYVMEYLQGIDFHTLVGNYGRQSPARVVFLLRQACLSLAEAHEMGLVHRDIKPANLFSCRLGSQYDFVKLLDFGIVRQQTGTAQTLAPDEPWKGTPATLSPEAAKGETTTPASDLYGLGCVAYWLLTGRNVFEAPDVMSMLLKHVTQPAESLRDQYPEIPEELDSLILQCLSKDPNERPINAAEILQRLEEIPLHETWGRNEAESWWKQNLPDESHRPPAANPQDTEETVVARDSTTA